MHIHSEALDLVASSYKRVWMTKVPSLLSLFFSSSLNIFALYYHFTRRSPVSMIVPIRIMIGVPRQSCAAHHLFYVIRAQDFFKDAFEGSIVSMLFKERALRSDPLFVVKFQNSTIAAL